MIKLLVAVCCLAISLTSLASPQSSPVVCIDPGHPSETSAGATARGLSENDLNWAVAIRVAAILKADGIGVVLTKKSRTSFVTNRQRAEIANKAGAAMFIRLHCDYGSSRGFTWYYPAHSGRKDGVTGPPPAICAQSGELAHELNASMAAELTGKLRGNPVKTDAATAVGSKQGGVLTGSIFSRVPTALIEMCTINQPIDAAFIASTDGQEAMATAIAHAIERALPAHPA